MDGSFPNYIIVGGKELEITIYQIIPELDKEHVKFRELASLQSLECSTPNAQIYEAIYHGKVNCLISGRYLPDIQPCYGVQCPIFR